MHWFSTLKQRGLIHDVSDEAAIASVGSGASFYVGFDPTAPSLHLGNLVPLVAALIMGRAGLKPVILFGGATGAIGDPSGKSVERPLLSRSEIEDHIAKHKRQVRTIFERVGVNAEFVDNYTWTKDFSLIDFLRDTGKHFTVNYMLGKETVKARLESGGISYTEFSYMLLQAHDFLHLYKHHNCELQLGGSDQWGNLTAGLELIRRKGLGPAHAFSIPLITNSQGKKFGKSEGGALWLDPSMTSPYKLHQFLLNTDDADVMRYLSIFSFREIEELKHLERALADAPEKREAHTALADDVCALIHGSDAVGQAKRGAAVLFGGSMEGIPEAQLGEIFSDVPSSAVDKAALASLSFLDLMVSAGAVPSRGEGKRLIKNGGAYLNNSRVNEPDLRVSDVVPDGTGLFVLRTGKKSYHVVRIE